MGILLMILFNRRISVLQLFARVYTQIHIFKINISKGVQGSLLTLTMQTRPFTRVFLPTSSQLPEKRLMSIPMKRNHEQSSHNRNIIQPNASFNAHHTEFCIRWTRRGGQTSVWELLAHCFSIW